MKISHFLACSLLLFAVAPAQSRQPLAIDRVIAIVNNEAITQHDLRDYLANVESQLRSQGTPLPPREVLEKQLIERLITDSMQIQFAKKTGLNIPDADLDLAVQRIAENNRLSLSDFRAAIQKSGIDWARAARADS